ncbi:MAG: DUF5666 domain-containing protein [Anaeromyxobacteraceae bacterium]
MRVRFLSLTLVAALAACGGSNNTPTNTGGGALTARTLQGAITAKTATSVTVNGVTTDDSANPNITFDDKANPSHDDLQVGQVVTVVIDDKGKTTEIRHEPEVRGQPDDAPTASTLTIAGQTVRVDDSTHFDDNNASRLAGITAADHVRVSGYPDDKGGIRATRIEKLPSSDTEFETRGTVSAVNASTSTFTLTTGTGATYTVTVTGALPSGVVNGAFVEVKSATKPAASGATITGATVRVEDNTLGGEGHEAEVEGIVAAGGTPSAFTIRGLPVTTSTNTKWVGGAPADLIPGVKVEAEGKLASGVLQATKVVFKDSLRFQGLVSAVTLASATDTKNGTFTMLGGTLKVHVSAVTEFDSGLIDLSSLTAQNVEVRGYQTVAGAAATGAGANDIVATRIKIGTGGGGGGGASTRVVIQGPISGLDATAKTFQILGYSINAASASSLSRDDTTPTSDVFAAGLANGMVLKARGDSAAALVGTTLTAKEIELEDDK